MSSPFNLSPWFTIVLTHISSVFEDLISRPALVSFNPQTNGKTLLDIHVTYCIQATTTLTASNVISFRQVAPFSQAGKTLRESRGIALLYFQTLALEGGGGSASLPGCFLPRERCGTHCTGGWVGPRGGPDSGKSRRDRDSIPRPQSVTTPTELTAESLAGTGIRSPDRSQSLYRLSYLAHVICFISHKTSFISQFYFFIFQQYTCFS